MLAILGDQATASDLVDLAEAQIIAAGGFVHPEAAATLQRALTLDPKDPAGRYYAALTDLQAGRADAAYRTWSTLVADGPPDAPWIAPARAGMAEAQRLASAPPGPSAADLAAAEDMPPAERQAMIQGMVDSSPTASPARAALRRTGPAWSARSASSTAAATPQRSSPRPGRPTPTTARHKRPSTPPPTTRGSPSDRAILADPAAFAAALPPRRA